MEALRSKVEGGELGHVFRVTDSDAGFKEPLEGKVVPG